MKQTMLAAVLSSLFAMSAMAGGPNNGYGNHNFHSQLPTVTAVTAISTGGAGGAGGGATSGNATGGSTTGAAANAGSAFQVNYGGNANSGGNWTGTGGTSSAGGTTTAGNTTSKASMGVPNGAGNQAIQASRFGGGYGQNPGCCGSGTVKAGNTSGSEQKFNGNSLAVGGTTLSATGKADASASDNTNIAGDAKSVTIGGPTLSGPAFGGFGGNGGNAGSSAGN